MIGVRSGCPRRRPVLPGAVTAAAALVVVTGCASAGDPSAKDPGLESLGPRSLQVQAIQISDDGPLTITAGGIGSGALDAQDRTEDAPTGGAVEDLPEGRHAQVVDLDSGEIVMTGSLPGGTAMAEPLADGSYRIGLLEVSETGWIDGIGTTSVEVRDGTMTVASLESGDRGLELSGVAVRGDDLHLEVAPTAPDVGQEGSWRLLGPGGEQTGTTTGGEAEIPSVQDGAYELEVRVGAPESPQIVTQSVRTRFSVGDGEVIPHRGAGSDRSSATSAALKPATADSSDRAPAAPVSAAPAGGAEQRPGDLPAQG